MPASVHPSLTSARLVKIMSRPSPSDSWGRKQKVLGLWTTRRVWTEVFVPLLLTTHRGLSPAMAGIFLTATAVAWASFPN